MASLAIPIIGAIGSIIGSMVGSGSANKAATTQSDAALEAAKVQAESAKYQTDALTKAMSEANSLQELQYLIGQQQNQPYQETGTGALLTLKDLMQPGGYLAEQAPDFNFDVSKVKDDPGYDFAMKEGLKAIERSAAAKGNALSGATSKALSRYGTDYATTKVNDVYNRDLTTYGTNQNTGNTNRGNLYNRLAALAGVGQTATQNSLSSGAQYATNTGNNLTGTANNNANVAMNAANNNANLTTSAAAARASGYAASGNIWNSALSGLTNLPYQYSILNSLTKK
jgi:hypothetical protein